MRVSTSPYPTVSYGQAKTQPTQESYSFIQANTIINQRTNDPAIWSELSQKYDIRKATTGEFDDIARQLYHAGQISLFDYGVMTFDPTKSPQSVKPNLFLTPTDQNGRRDWIAEFEARAEQQLTYNNTLGYDNYQKIAHELERLVR